MCLGKYLRESMIALVTLQPIKNQSSQIANAAIILSANVDKINILSSSESELLKDWLSRIK